RAPRAFPNAPRALPPDRTRGARRPARARRPTPASTSGPYRPPQSIVRAAQRPPSRACAGSRDGTGPIVRLQGPEERDEVALLRLGEPQAEAHVVEVDDVPQARGRAVVEVGRAAGEPAQDRPLEAPDVLPEPGDQRPAGVGDDLDLARRLVAEGVDRHVPDGQAGPAVDGVAAPREPPPP